MTKCKNCGAVLGPALNLECCLRCGAVNPDWIDDGMHEWNQERASDISLMSPEEREDLRWSKPQ